MVATLVGIAPLVPVRDLGVSIVLARDGARIGLQGGGDAGTLEVTRRHIAAYVLVRDLDVLRSEIAPSCEALTADRVRAGFRQDYGVRELHLKDPDGFLMLFGEAADTNVEEP